jgi:hypothetical protein
MSLDDIFGDVADEMSRAIRLQMDGRITRTPSNPESTNIESISTLNEEVSEVQDEVIHLLSAMIGLSQQSGKATRTVNDLEEILFRWHLDPPSRITEDDRTYICQLRAKLEQELVQVAAVACSFLLRLRDEAHDRRTRSLS